MPHQPPLDVRLFEWVDHHGWAYWLIAWSTFAWFAAAALAPLVTQPAGGGNNASACPRRLRLLASPALFVVAVVALLCAFRWPLWFAGPLENPDEAEWIAGALTLRHGGLPWKSIDCHTSGPLSPATLLLTIPLGLPLNYVGVRIFTSLLQAACMLALWRAGRRFVPEWVARLALLPAANFWACRWFHDIGQYSSELTSVLLLSVAGWCGAVAVTTQRSRLKLVLLALAGALAATAPLLAKPQSAPLALALGTVLLVALLRAPERNPQPSGPRSAATPGVAALVLGAAAPFLLLGAYLAIYGLGAQFRVFYWQSNVLYTAEHTYGWPESATAFAAILAPVSGATACVLGAVGFAVLALGSVPRSARSHWSRLAGAWLLLAAAIIAVVAPGRIERQHYLHLVVIPLSWLSAVSLAAVHERLSLAAVKRAGVVVAGAFVLVTSTGPVWRTSLQTPPMNGQLYFWRERQTTLVGEYVRALAEPGDELVVWGWSPGYHVETSLPQGSREAHCGLIINPGPLQSHYRDRLLFDLRRHRPRWFIDAVAPGHFGYRDRASFGHETVPDLRMFIAAHYELVDDFDGVRVYRRRDSDFH